VATCGAVKHVPTGAAFIRPARFVGCTSGKQPMSASAEWRNSFRLEACVRQNLIRRGSRTSMGPHRGGGSSALRGRQGQIGILGGTPMQPLPPQLELPEGDRFTLPTVSAVRELVPPGGQLPAHMVLKMICGKELWVPLDREIARQMANILASFRE
jgi:hypothetical protein